MYVTPSSRREGGVKNPEQSEVLVKQLTLGEFHALDDVNRTTFFEKGYHKPKCLLTVAPGKWKHPDAQVQVRLVAAWCNCERCYSVLFNYYKGFPNG